MHLTWLTWLRTNSFLLLGRQIFSECPQPWPHTMKLGLIFYGLVCCRIEGRVPGINPSGMQLWELMATRQFIFIQKMKWMGWWVLLNGNECITVVSYGMFKRSAFDFWVNIWMEYGALWAINSPGLMRAGSRQSQHWQISYLQLDFRGRKCIYVHTTAAPRK